MKREAALAGLLRVNRALLARILRHDLALIAGGVVYVLAGERGVRMSVPNGVFVVSGLLLLGAAQMQTLARAAPDLRNFLVLPLPRGHLLAAFYAGFALPGALLMAAAGLAAAPFARTPGAATRVFFALLAFVFLKSLLVNLLAAIRWHLFFVPVYFALLTGLYLFLIAVRDLTAGAVSLPAGAIALLFVAANVAGTFGVVRELEF